MKNKCRFCHSPLENSFISLGVSPLANSFLAYQDLEKMEPFFPLDVYICHECFLVQIPAWVSRDELFSDYVYFSSYSDSWLAHCRFFSQTVLDRFPMDSGSLVVEIASNDGYLLQFFQEAGIRVLGIEPAVNVADVAIKKGIPTEVAFFGIDTAERLASKGTLADLIIANNVLAHVPDINDFVVALKKILKPRGWVSLEFPHLLRLIEGLQFDTIYHEHFSYFSLRIVDRIFRSHGLIVFDVEEISTHGGSLRLYARHKENDSLPLSLSVSRILQLESESGLNCMENYRNFTNKVEELRCQILRFFIEAKENGKRIAGYGAPAKGNTLLNYCGIRSDWIEYSVDRSIQKQGKYLPGSHIPVFPPQRVFETKPDYLIIFPWNIRQEIMEQMNAIREWGGRFVTLVPQVEVD